MEESILTSIKLSLGIDEDYDSFDKQLIMHINSVLAALVQMGVGPEEGFAITDHSAVWSDFLSSNAKLEYVKSYVFLRVRLLFDPPQSSALIQAMNDTIHEFEWRGFVECDPKLEIEEDN